MVSRSPAFIVVSMVASGCFFSANVPDDVLIRCGGDDDCPDNFVCRSSLERCVPASLLGEEAPRILSASVEPEHARAGSEVRATLVVAGQLGERVVVFGQSAAAPIEFRAVDPSDETDEIAFLHVVDDADAEGVMTVHADVVARSGDATRGVLLGTTTIDRTAPVLQAVALPPGPVRRGERVEIELQANEPMTAKLSLLRDDDAPIVLTPLQAQGALLTFVFDGQLDGTYTVSVVDAADLAGNLVAADVAGDIVVDGEAPVIGDFSVSPARVSHQPGFSTVTAVFALDQRDQDSEIVATLAGRPLSCSVSTDGVVSTDGLVSVTCAGDVVAEDTGSVVVDVVVIDGAGNRSVNSGTALVDADAPLVVPGSVLIQYTSGAQSVLASVSALGGGGTAVVSFATDEPLGAEIVAELDGAGPADINLLPAAGALHRFAIVDGGLVAAQGAAAVPIRVSVVDAVGNAAVRLLDAALVVDGTAPDPPDTSPGRMVLERRPSGSLSTGSVASSRLVVDIAAVEPGATLIGFNRSAPPRAELFRVDTTEISGVATFALDPQDRVEVFVAQADRAGNLSSTTLVKDGRFTIVDPELSADPRYDRRALAPRGGLLGQGGRRAGVIDDAIDARAFPSPTYSLRASAQGLSGNPVVFDRARGEVVAIDSIPMSWDGERLALLSTVFATDLGFSLEAVWDERRGVIVAFGLCDALTSCPVYEWDGSWNARRTALVPRRTHAMTWDPVRERVLIFGGVNNAISSTSMLEVDFGGYVVWGWSEQGEEVVAAFDPSIAGEFTEASRMAFDEERGVIQILPSSTATPILVEIDGDGAVQTFPVVPPLEAATFIRDAARDRTLWIASSGVWSFVDGTWALIDDAVSLTDRIVFDERRDVLVEVTSEVRDLEPNIFVALGAPRRQTSVLGGPRNVIADRAGGRVIATAAPLGNQRTLAWDGFGWRLIHSQPIPPAFQRAFDDPARARQRVFAFSGTLDDWVHDGATWTLAAQGVATPLLSSSALAFDEARERLLAFGGLCSGCGDDEIAHAELYEYDGAAWTFVGDRLSAELDDVAWPSSRARASAAFHPASNAVVLVGGSDEWTDVEDTAWLYDGAQWFQVPGPTPRALPALVVDPASGDLLLFGGVIYTEPGRIFSPEAPLADWWRFDGSAFVAIAAPVDRERLSTTVRLGNARAADWARGQVLADVTSQDTAVIDTRLSTAALHTVFDMRTLSLPSTAAFVDLELTVVSAAGEAGLVVDVYAPHRGLQTHATVPAGETARLPIDLSALFKSRIHVALAAPASSSGVAALDAIELNVSYRLP